MCWKSYIYAPSIRWYFFSIFCFSFSNVHNWILGTYSEQREKRKIERKNGSELACATYSTRHDKSLWILMTANSTRCQNEYVHKNSRMINYIWFWIGFLSMGTVHDARRLTINGLLATRNSINRFEWIKIWNRSKSWQFWFSCFTFLFCNDKKKVDLVQRSKLSSKNK